MVILRYKLSSLLLILIIFAGCKGGRTLDLFKKPTPYQQYERILKDAKLDNTALGRTWLKAGVKAINDSLTISLPFSETGYFSESEPAAVAYQFFVKQGEKIVIKVDVNAAPGIKLFIDLFEKQTNKLNHLASADSLNKLVYEVKTNGLLAVRLQPELLQQMQYTMQIHAEPSIEFPVSGKNNRSVGSFFGDARDAGKRKHEGIDVFAAKKTPVLAVAKGVVASTRENNLGGKVVFIYDKKRSLSYYYAHLDTQYVQSGQMVNLFDTIGLVGNSGNAKFTAPHLHFGIYAAGKGAIDPLPFVWSPDSVPAKIVSDLGWLGKTVRAKTNKISFSSSPNGVVYKQFPKNTIFKIQAAASNWYRIEMPNGLAGYLQAGAIEKAEKPYKSIKNQKQIVLLNKPLFSAVPVDSIVANSELSVLGEADDFYFISTPSGKIGWIKKL